MAVEEHAMRIATKERTQTDVSEVEALIEAMETPPEPPSLQYLQQWMSTNRLFHTRLIECAHRKRVSEVALNLRDAIEPYMRIEANFNRQVGYANVEHRKIFEAFKRKDSSGRPAEQETLRKYAQTASRQHRLSQRRSLCPQDRVAKGAPLVMKPLTPGGDCYRE